MAGGKSEQGRESERNLKKSVAEEERKVEAAKGSPLAKGGARVEERARSASSERDEDTKGG